MYHDHVRVLSEVHTSDLCESHVFFFIKKTIKCFQTSYVSSKLARNLKSFVIQAKDFGNWVGLRLVQLLNKMQDETQNHSKCCDGKLYRIVIRITCVISRFSF